MSVSMAEHKKSYNVLALRGADVDDMEYVEQFELDPAVAYTPKINQVMLDMTYQQNMDFYISEGKPEVEAKTMAMNERKSAEKTINTLLAKRGMLR